MITVLLCVFFLPVISASGRYFQRIEVDEYPSWINQCSPQLDGTDWILSQRRANYGWGEDTHRAIIALAVNRTSWSLLRDKKLMMRQLEIEITKELLRNSTTETAMSDLSLYIHALLATGLNPRDFYGQDLVAMLEYRVANESKPHPISVLALCNAGVVNEKFLWAIKCFLDTKEKSSQSRELQAIALKAFLCVKESAHHFPDPFRNDVHRAIQVLAASHEADGSFGNVYATSFVVQALVASNYTRWDHDLAEEYLRSRAGLNVNMLSTYCIILALNARDVPFIKYIARRPDPLITPDGFPSITELKSRPKPYYIQYTIRITEFPKMYFTVTTKIPLHATFFDVMRLTADEDDKFRFSYSLDSRNRPMVYSISGVPNDAETGYYWRLIMEDDVDHDRHVSKLTEIVNCTNEVFPARNTHWIFWYLNAFHNLPYVNSDVS